ncbi:MAG: FliI/YscN family ATPase [Alphaproteobacteria bacterium]|nr:FliI/YscN family ATPase [Alphaproteobacteria bacterium]
MTRSSTERLTRDAASIRGASIWGRVSAVDQSVIRVVGLNAIARAGQAVEIDAISTDGESAALLGEIIAMNQTEMVVYAYNKVRGVKIGDRARLLDIDVVAPSARWLGELIDPLGYDMHGTKAPVGDKPRRLDSAPPAAGLRRGFGERMACGLNVFDTFLPICRGQRVGLFAAPGVGKSSLVASLATRAEADVVVVALIGERGREVRAFFDKALTEDVRARTVVFAATSDQPAPLKKRAAQLAMTAAEHFRDDGKHVLFLFDSLTRFADAHREIALASGEPPSIRAYPPSTFQALSSLVERAGPGAAHNKGDITGVFTVLAAAGDMDAPVPDAIRGFLDGHFVLERTIAERGRFPAIDVLKSASRSLPEAATDAENHTLLYARKLLGAYRDGEIMVKAGLYDRGADPTLDAALSIHADLDGFLAGKSGSIEEAFATLSDILREANVGAAPMAKVS